MPNCDGNATSAEKSDPASTHVNNTPNINTNEQHKKVENTPSNGTTKGKLAKIKRDMALETNAPVEVTFEDVSAAAFRIKSGVRKTPCEVRFYGVKSRENTGLYDKGYYRICTEISVYGDIYNYIRPALFLFSWTGGVKQRYRFHFTYSVFLELG